MPNATANGHATREPGTLFDSELWWRDHYQVLENRGYRLRPRYRSDWVPSWKISGKEFNTAEDGQPTLLPMAMDAAHVDGRQVMLKSVPVRRGQQELEIARTVSSPELRRHPRNHCVPLLDVLELPNTLDRKLMVTPFLRPFNEPRFRTYGEFVDFFTQICEGLQFMHEQKIAHRNCTANSIMLDPSGMYPNGFHPVQIDRSRDFKGKLQRYNRTQRPPRYYLTDFSLSRKYISRNVLDEPLVGDDMSAPEHQYNRWCNPFRTDIYHLGNLVRECFMKKYNGFEFMKELVDAMTAVDPGKRPTIEEVVANFSRICESSRAFKLRFPTTDNRSWLGKRISLRVEGVLNRAADTYQSEVTGEGGVVLGSRILGVLTRHIVATFRSPASTSTDLSAFSSPATSSVSVYSESEVYGAPSVVEELI